MKKKLRLKNTEKKALLKLTELAKEIKKHNVLYHKYYKPKISDYEYDQLIKKNDFLEKKFPHLKLKDSPNYYIGTKSSNKFSKVNHKAPMLSLQNAFEENDLKEFIKRIKKYLYNNNLDLSFICEPKIDGLSLSLKYENKELVYAATRGDGLIGEDVTNNVKSLNNIPLEACKL